MSLEGMISAKSLAGKAKAVTIIDRLVANRIAGKVLRRAALAGVVFRDINGSLNMIFLSPLYPRLRPLRTLATGSD